MIRQALSRYAYSNGAITDADLFTAYLRYWGLDSKLQVATYSIRKTLTIPELSQVITNPNGSLVTLRVIEGWRIEQIAEAIDALPELTFRGSDFLALVGAGAAQGSLVQQFVAQNGIPAGRSLEGFLYPATYTIPVCETAPEVVSRFLNAFDANVSNQLRSDIAARNLTMYQVVTMASIIEREAVVDDERPTIASVYWNRYMNSISATPNTAIPTTLDADPTIQYALGNTRTAGNWWPSITQADYRGVQSPYNTYLNRGLPPGPIANPRAASIEAAAYPAQTGYIYFRASCAGDGRHQFATTFEEQVANGCS
ncbi:MAG: endolytic transglycosylase MltG [Anaerolineae bacterium]